MVSVTSDRNLFIDFIFYMPFSAKIKQKEKEIAAVKQEIRVIEQDINNSIDIKRKGNQIKAYSRNTDAITYY